MPHDTTLATRHLASRRLLSVADTGFHINRRPSSGYLTLWHRQTDVHTRFWVKRRIASGRRTTRRWQTDAERCNTSTRRAKVLNNWCSDVDTRRQIKRRRGSRWHTTRRWQPDAERRDAFLPDADTILNKAKTSLGTPYNTTMESRRRASGW
jgi:hypothetical protein